MASNEKLIMQAIEAKLLELTPSDLKTVNRDKIFLSFEDFSDPQFPVAQIIAGPTQAASQQGRHIDRIFSVSVELVLKTTQAAEVDQDSLLDLFKVVETKVLEGFPFTPAKSVFNIIPRTVQPDLHLIEPHYIAIIVFEISYQDKIRQC